MLVTFAIYFIGYFLIICCKLGLFFVTVDELQCSELVSVNSVANNMIWNNILSGTNKSTYWLDFIRYASKKTGGSTKNTNCKVRPKHRGWKVQDGHYVQAGHILATQRTTRFHPGLNVGFGRNGTLFAMEPGKVVVTCEKFDPFWEHTWVQRIYSGREAQKIFKKYFNVIPNPQHQRFKLVDEI